MCLALTVGHSRPSGPQQSKWQLQRAPTQVQLGPAMCLEVKKRKGGGREKKGGREGEGEGERVGARLRRRKWEQEAKNRCESTDVDMQTTEKGWKTYSTRSH